jgi:malate dehydrogenase (oxaloacetate-decarboxylating)
VATATLLDPVPYNGVIYEIGQANNFLAFPGLGLGVIVAGARRVTKAMMQADAKAIAAQTDPTTMGALATPEWGKPVRVLGGGRPSGVRRRPRRHGGTRTPDNLVHAIADTMWQPEYEWGHQQ